MKHLLSIDDLQAPQIDELMRLTDSFVEVSQRQIPKVPALRGRTVVSVFFEESTRTRLSFETAAKRMSADVMTFSAGSSSMSKGESVKDTIETIEAMGVDALVVRHRCAGTAHQVARWTDATVINGGDGAHQHPTQALLDAYTLRSRFGSLEGRRVAFVGDIAHSRVARSGITALTRLGANVVLVGPPTLIPPRADTWPVEISYELDPVLADLDAVYLLRLQRERMREALLPSMREYAALYGLTADRAAKLADHAVVMHPGPMNRGVELASEVAEAPAAVVRDQVRYGVAVRMAVLWSLLGSGTPLAVGRNGPEHHGREGVPTGADSIEGSEEDSAGA